MSLASEVKMENEILNIISDCMNEPRMVILGCGGAGIQTVGRMGGHFKGVPRIAVNTDMTGLRLVDADRKICIGKSITFNHDSGGYIEVAQRCAELAQEDIRSCLISKDVVFIVAGFGGGTGTGVAPMVAEMAKGLGLVTFAVCILPFSAESSRREMAEEHVEKLRLLTDSTIALDNDALLKFDRDISLSRAYSIMDSMVVKIIRDVSDSMSRSFMAVMADEIMAFRSETDLSSLGGSQPGFTVAECGIAADQGFGPLAYPQPSDKNLVEMGGVFQRF
jgi:cell division protein FtsZ